MGIVFCRHYFPGIIIIFLIENYYFLHAAVKFLRDAPEGMYDAIIVDSSDPIGM